MPEYLLRCTNGHERWVWQPMVTKQRVMCIKCGSQMWRKPLAPAINWNGLKPSAGELHPDIKNLVDTQSERREAFDQEHEEHERRTE